MAGVLILNSVLDGREASIRVRNYFFEVHGALGVLAFEIMDVRFNEQEKVWIVRCGFFTSILAPQKTYFEVRVSEDGKIQEVTQTTGPQ